MKHIVKRKGHKELYDEKKVYASVYSSCLNAHHDEQAAEGMAQNVMNQINELVADRDEIDSKEIRRHVIKMLKEIDKDAQILYESIFDVC